jgi:hypothetical protein
MVDHEIWRVETVGVLAAELCDFRLIVQAPEAFGGAIQFLVLRPGGQESRGCLIGSGTREDLSAAKFAAERMAERCAGLGLGQGAQSR